MRNFIPTLALVVTCALAVACGGGGGGGGGGSGSSTSVIQTRGASGFYTVRLKSGSDVSSFSVAGAYENTITDSNKLTFLKSSGNIVIAIQDSTTVQSELLVALDGGQPTGNKLSGEWLGSIYGKTSTSVVNGLLVQLSFDSAGNVTFSKHTESSGTLTLDSALPVGNLSIANGKVTWGNWSGMTTQDGSKILLSHNSEKLVLLAAKTGNYAQISLGSYSSAYMYHNNGIDIKSGKNVLTFATASGNTSVSGVVGTQNYTWPTITYATGNSYIGLNNNNSPAGVEPGFRADSEFFVIVNTSSSVPFFLVAPLP